MLRFDPDLFAEHPHPFCAYHEPEGFAALSRTHRLHHHHYRSKTPATWAVAEAMCAQLRLPWQWAVQICEGGWPTETVGTQVHRFARPGYERGFRWGRPLRTLTIAKALAGQTFAVANTDRHSEEWCSTHGVWADYYGGEPHGERINVLRVDVDHKDAWRRLRVEPVARQIRFERQIALALGLEYRCFRTGNKGHQAVLPLPVPVTVPVARWLLCAFHTLLRPHCQPGAVLDATNLDQLVRLPGGRHALTGNLALWIDVDTMRLFTVSEQADMMRTGFLSAAGDVEEFRSATWELGRYLTELGLTECNHFGDQHFQRVVEELPFNSLVQRYCEALPAVKSAAPMGQRLDPASETQPQVDSAWTEARARAVWEQVVEEGGFHRWLIEAGGIHAAYHLFGSPHGCEQLLARAGEVPYSSPEQIRERRRVISWYWDRYNPPRRRNLIEGSLVPEDQALLDRIMEEVEGSPRVRRDAVPTMRKVAHILLLALRETPTGEIQVSLQALADSVNHAFAGSDLHRMDVQRALDRLVAGRQKCCFQLVEASGRCEGQVRAQRFRAGADLLDAGFLPVVEPSPETPARRAPVIPVVSRRRADRCALPTCSSSSSDFVSAQAKGFPDFSQSSSRPAHPPY